MSSATSGRHQLPGKRLLQKRLPPPSGALEVGGDQRGQILHHAQPPLLFDGQVVVAERMPAPKTFGVAACPPSRVRRDALPDFSSATAGGGG